MDLYADLPLAKGASSAALDADGKLKTAAGGTGSSVWKTTAPAFVPQVMRNSHAIQQAGRDKVVPPPINTPSSVSMLPAALRSKSPHGTVASGDSNTSTSPATAVKKPSGISLAFKPVSITRKSVVATATSSVQSQFQPPSLDDKLEDAELRPRGIGFGFSTVTTQVRIQRDDGENQQPAVNGSSAATDSAVPSGGVAASTHFFQSNYRDEYNPARPNSYEAYCEERLNKKKLEQVKRELERRQVEQEREGKLEREKLVRDIEAGKAPAVDLPAAGRGRGMTMPAWMRKKMEETAAAKQANEAHTQQVNPSAAEVGQFEDAAPRTGLGFHSSEAGLGFSRPETSRDSRSAENSLRSVPPPLCDEFGREIKRDGSSNDDQSHKRGRDDGDGNVDKERQNQQPQQDSNSSRLSNATRDQADPSSSYKRQRDHEALQKCSSGCVILLQNMVGPGEVDDELQDEVKEECAEKYGPVEKCVIYEVKGVRVPPEQAVRIFVQFQRHSDAEKARLGLNARFFGGRKVQAAYYDENKFRRLDLTA